MRAGVFVFFLAAAVSGGCQPGSLAVTKPAPPTSTMVQDRWEAVQVVFLHSVPATEETPELAVELVRQSILIALREEFGLFTRDESLGDALPSPLDRSVIFLVLKVRKHFDSQWLYQVVLRDGNQEQVLAVIPVQTSLLAPSGEHYYSALAQHLEELSRSSLPHQLQKAGLLKRLKQSDSLHALQHAGAEILGSEDQDSVDLFRRWWTVEVAHALRHSKSSKPELLAALARSYARLASMHPQAGRAFGARALLYAQRLSALTPGTEMQRKCWFEALAAAGLHAEALRVFEQPSPLNGIDAQALALACRYDVQGLERLWKETQHPAVGHFWVLALRATPQLTRQRQEAALAVVSRYPSALHLVEGLWMLNASPEVELGKQIADWLPRFPDLPLELRQGLEENQSLAKILGNLADLGRRPECRSELSWTVLARRLQDLILQETIIRVNRLFDDSDGAERLVKDRLPLLRNHPGEKQLQQLFSVRGSGEGDIRYEASSFLMEPPHQDSASADVVLRLRQQHKLSPWHPGILANLVLVDQDPSWRSRWLQAAEASGQAHVIVLEALAEQARRDGQIEKQTSLWEKRLALSPDWSACERLAQLYWEQGKWEAWEATLKAFARRDLEVWDRGQAWIALARGWLQRGDPARAVPFGLEAERTGLRAGVLCSIDCLTAAGQFDRAEQTARRFARHWRQLPHVWLFWCLRTGRGNREQAQQLVDDYLSQLGSGGNVYDFELRGTLALLRDSPATAAEAFCRAWEEGRHVYALQHLVLAQMTLQQDWRKTALLCRQVTQNPKDAEAQAAQVFWEILMKELSSGPVDDDQILHQLKGLDGRGRSNQGYFVGRLLELHGGHQAARRCYQLSVAANEPWQWNTLLSQRRLEKLGQ